MAAKHRTATRSRQAGRNRRAEEFGDLPLSNAHDEPWGPRPSAFTQNPKRAEPLRPRTDAQRQYIAAIQASTLTLGLGPAGTGKTFCSVGVAADMLREGKIERFIATRPAVTAEEDLGFTPGGIDEKFAPYFQPILDVLHKRLGHAATTAWIREGKIVALPIGFMRGLTFEKAFVLVDEAQNTTPSQLKMILTRLGEESKIVVEGDEEQSDIRGPNGLADVRRRFASSDSVRTVEFTEADVVRSGFVREVLAAYRATGFTDGDTSGLHRTLGVH